MLPITVYSPESPLRHPIQFLRAVFRDLPASRELAWRFFMPDTDRAAWLPLGTQFPHSCQRRDGDALQNNQPFMEIPT